MKRYPTKLLGEFIEERTERLRGDTTTIYSVTNERGFVRSLDLFDKQVFSADTGNYKRVEFRDLAYNPSRINVGSIALCEDKNGGAVSPMYVIVRTKHGLLPYYLLHFLKSDAGLHHIRHRCEGAVRFQLKFRDLCAIPITMPPLTEQEQIVKLLDETDELRKLRAQADCRSADLIPALFHEMFGDPVRNEMGWPMKPFGALVSNQDGRRKPVKASDRAERNGEYPYYGASGIIDYVDDFIFDETALLIAEDGANLLARSTPIAFMASGKYWVNNHAHIVAENGKADLNFLCAALNLRDLTGYVTGSAQPKLNQASMNRISIIVPPLPLQQEFAQRVSEIRELQAAQAASRQRTEHLFQSMLHRAFSQEL